MIMLSAEYFLVYTCRHVLLVVSHLSHTVLCRNTFLGTSMCPEGHCRPVSFVNINKLLYRRINIFLEIPMKAWPLSLAESLDFIILKFSFFLPDLVKVPHATGMFWQKSAQLVPRGEKQLPQPAG